jgi:hypothetical protein
VANELSDLFASYNSYIDRSIDTNFNVDDPHLFSEHLWGQPLTFAEFKRRWERICKDSALERLWRKRLAAGRERAMREMGDVIDRLARAANTEGEKAA